MNRNLTFGTLLLAAIVGSFVDSEAQEQAYPYGYLSHLEGELSVQRASELTPEPGELNLPVLPGDRIWTLSSSRAEVLISEGVTLRLDGETKLDFVELGERILLRLWNGRAILHLDEGATSVHIDSPAGTLEPSAPGAYRIDVSEGESLTLFVLRGSAQLASGGGAVLVSSGETSRVLSDELPEIPSRFNTARLDAFDRWSDARDRGLSESQDVVLRSLPHALQDDARVLYDYGTWRNEPSYGYVWYPQVSTGWAPYRFGRWCYTPWGYTWVSHDPWGWTPHHYGRWGFNHHGWYWIPGSTFGPAWVSFAIGPAWIGWSPLGFHNAPVFAFHKRGFHQGDRFKFHHRGGWNFTHRKRFRSRHAVWASEDDRELQELVSSGDARAELLESGAVLDRDLTPRTAVPRGRLADATRGAGSFREGRTAEPRLPARETAFRGRERSFTAPGRSANERGAVVRESAPAVTRDRSAGFARDALDASREASRRESQDPFRSRARRDGMSSSDGVRRIEERAGGRGSAERRVRGSEPVVSARRGQEDASASGGSSTLRRSEVTGSRGAGFRRPAVDGDRGATRSRDSSPAVRAPSSGSERRFRSPGASSSGRPIMSGRGTSRSSGSERVGRAGVGGAPSGRRMAAPGSSSSSRGSALGAGGHRSGRSAGPRSRPPQN